MAGTSIDEHGDVWSALETSVRDAGAEVTAENLPAWMGADKGEAITALIGLGSSIPEPFLAGDTSECFRELWAATIPPRRRWGCREWTMHCAPSRPLVTRTVWPMDILELWWILGYPDGAGAWGTVKSLMLWLPATRWLPDALLRM